MPDLSAIGSAQHLLQAGRFAEAEALLRSLGTAHPYEAEVTHLLGLAIWQQGRRDEGRARLDRSLALKPANAMFKRNFAALLINSADPAAASQACVIVDELLRATPLDTSLRVLAAQAADASGRHAAAALTWRWLLDHGAAADGRTWFCYASSLDFAGDAMAAAEAYRQTLSRLPDDVTALRRFSAMLLRLGSGKSAIPLLERLVRLMPDDTESIGWLGQLLGEFGQPTRAIQLLEPLASRPGGERLLRALGTVYSLSGRSDLASGALHRSMQQHPDFVTGISLLLNEQYVVPDDPPRQLQLHRSICRTLTAGIRPLPPRKPTSVKNRRLRIGYVSADFRKHSVGGFILPLLERHDRKRFEVHCFTTHEHVDDVTRRARAACDAWHLGYLHDDAGLAQLVREQAIDVLIDLAGHTAGTRLFMFAYRPAPLQVTYLGYPNTTGLEAIDARITDAIADPAGETDKFHVERLLRMPHVFATFRPAPEATPVLPPPVLRAGHITFGSVVAMAKVNAAVLDVWAEALHRVPSSRLLHVSATYQDAGIRDRIATEFGQRGVGPSRLEFIGWLDAVEYMKFHDRVDIMLDSFPFNGHTTTLQNLWMGVPVITLAGHSHRSRMGASVLTSVGLQDWIATSPDDFAAIAARMSGSPSHLAGLRQTMRDRMKASPLMDEVRFARDFEQLILDNWEALVKRG